MMYDRDYMKSEFEPADASVARPLVIAVVMGFILQAVIETAFHASGQQFLFNHLALSLSALSRAEIWTLATYPFLQPGIDFWSVIAVVFNAIMIHMFGRMLIPAIGARGFWQLAAGAVGVGALATLIVGLGAGLPGVAVGSSAIVLALLTVFACLHPDRPISILLAFVIPVTIKPKHLAWFVAGLTAFWFIFFELQGKVSATPPSNLLGGMLAGWLFHRFVHRPGAVFRSTGPAVDMPAWLKRKKKAPVAVAAAPYKVNVTPQSPADVRAEVDRILDKINLRGFGSLTADERRLLDEARDTLNKR